MALFPVDRGGWRKLIVVCGAPVVVTALLLLFARGYDTLVIAVLLGGTFAFVAAFGRAALISAVLAYSMVLGDLRRMRDVLLSHPTLDPLVLLVPTIAAALAIPILLRVRLRDALSKSMFFLLILLILEIFNPLQGGISVGVGGALFRIVPVFWFWIGREYGTPKLMDTMLYRVFLPFACLAAALGIYQEAFGVLPYQQAWFDQDPARLLGFDVGGNSLRSFGYFISGQEYANTVCMGVVAATAAWFSRRRNWSLGLLLLLPALLTCGSRGPILKAIMGIAFVWAFRKGSALSPAVLLRLVLFMVLGFGGLFYLAQRLAPDQPTGEQSSRSVSAGAALNHETSGFADINNSKKSTLGLHNQIVLEAFIKGFTNPIGFGTGYGTPAAAKFGVDSSGAESDYGDMFLSLGAVGGLVYLYINFLVFRSLPRYVRQFPLAVSLPTLGILVAIWGAWMLGAAYSISAFCLFFIGSISYGLNAQSTGSGLPLPARVASLRGTGRVKTPAVPLRA